jgi:hypothetical protein
VRKSLKGNKLAFVVEQRSEERVRKAKKRKNLSFAIPEHEDKE